jgi:hypothetical protein
MAAVPVRAEIQPRAVAEWMPETQAAVGTFSRPHHRFNVFHEVGFRATHWAWPERNAVLRAWVAPRHILLRTSRLIRRRGSWLLNFGTHIGADGLVSLYKESSGHTNGSAFPVNTIHASRNRSRSVRHW